MSLEFLGTLSWVGLVCALASYVVIRALIMQGGTYLFVTRSALAARKKVYRLPYSLGQLKSELLSTAVVVAVDAVFIASIIKAGFFSTSDENILFAFVLNFVWFEIWFYASHRLLHTKALYFLHKQHHVAKVASPFTAFSFSVGERLILLTGAFGMPILISQFIAFSSKGTALYLFVNYSLNIFAHSNLELIPPRWLNSVWGRFLNAPTYHALHHSRYQGHFGLFTPYLDQIFKTRFKDYPLVQSQAYRGQGLSSLGQRLTQSSNVESQ